MTLSSGSPPNHIRGFSLLELLVVLAIFSMVLSAGAFLIRGNGDAMRLNLVSRNFSALLVEARLHAIEKNQVVPIIFDATKGRFIGPTSRLSLQFDPDLSIRFTGARVSQQKQDAGNLRFFPDGSSTGGEIVLNLNNQVSRLYVDWMTGVVRSEND